jgi:GT2 family glycosyltransferase
MKIAAVIVTFNRKILLEEVLDSFDDLIDGPEQLIVVNNNSTDGTKEFLDLWKNESSNFEKTVINLDHNVGGSGGFYAGLEFASKLDVDWIWLSDDDAFPYRDAFLRFRNHLNNMNNIDAIAAVCCRVVNKNKIDLAHRRRLKDFFLYKKEVVVAEEEYSKESFSLDLFSYVGVFINIKHLNIVGLTEKDYFIWYDDTEHSYRLSKSGKILCFPDIMIKHDVEYFDVSNTWKSYYGIRNRLLMYKNKSYKTYLCLILKYKIKSFFSKNAIEKEIIYSALFDASKNIDGLHCKYNPSWKK